MSPEHASQPTEITLEDQIVSLNAQIDEANANFEGAEAGALEKKKKALEAKLNSLVEAPAGEATVMQKLEDAKAGGDPTAIAEAEVAADAKFRVKAESTTPETPVDGERELTTIEEINQRITDLESSDVLTDTYYTKQEQEILSNSMSEWLDTEAGIAKSTAKDKGITLRDVYLMSEQPKLYKKIQRRRIINAEIKGFENQKEDMARTAEMSVPHILGLISMDHNEALGLIRRKQNRNPIGDYDGFDISGREYISGVKSLMANPHMGEDDKLRKIATLQLLIGGYQGGYFDSYGGIVDNLLTTQQKEKIDGYRKEFAEAASKYRAP